MSFFSEEISSGLLAGVKGDGQVSVIQELEMFALPTSLVLWSGHVTQRRVVVFTDSESVRGSFLKTWSNNDQCPFHAHIGSCGNANNTSRVVWSHWLRT